MSPAVLPAHSSLAPMAFHVGCPPRCIVLDLGAPSGLGVGVPGGEGRQPRVKEPDTHRSIRFSQCHPVSNIYRRCYYCLCGSHCNWGQITGLRPKRHWFSFASAIHWVSGVLNVSHSRFPQLADISFTFFYSMLRLKK